MRLGIDCRFFSQNFTGIGRYTHELVDHFAQALKPSDELILFFNNPEYKNYQPPAKNIKKILVNAPHYSLKEQTHFLKHLRQANCDIVHFPHFNVPLLYRRPYIVTIHDLILTLFPGNKMTKWYHRLAYNLTIRNAIRTARHVITVSDNTKQDIITHFGTNSKKITTIYNGISPQFTLLTDQASIDKTLKHHKIPKPFLLYTGVHRSHKNLPRLIEAFNILLTEHQLPLHLVITGRPDPHYPEPQELVQKLQLSAHVTFTGLVDEQALVHLYNAAHVYVFPSLYEGFGFPPLESMHCGTPVVAARTSSIPEVCGQNLDAPTALFFDPYDPADLAAKVRQLFQDTSLQATLIENGARHASTFTWPKTAKLTFELISPHAKLTT